MLLQPLPSLLAPCSSLFNNNDAGDKDGDNNNISLKFPFFWFL